MTTLADRLSSELRALADAAEVRELDVAALRAQVTRARRRKRTVGVLVAVLAAVAIVPVVGALQERQAGDRLASDADGEPSYVRVVSRESLSEGADLPAEVDACLTESATEVSPSPDLVLRLDGTRSERSEVLDCLRGVEGVQVLPQSGPEPRPVRDPRSGEPRLTQEQASRPGVDATAECSPPSVRESAPPFEGEAPIETAQLVAGYLTDQHGHAEWAYEYEGSISFGNEPLTDRLVRLCWYAGSGEYQLVVSAVDGGALPSSSTRGPTPLPILAPPPPRAMTDAEVERRAVVFPQPPGVEVQAQ